MLYSVLHIISFFPADREISNIFQVEVRHTRSSLVRNLWISNVILLIFMPSCKYLSSHLYHFQFMFDKQQQAVGYYTHNVIAELMEGQLLEDIDFQIVILTIKSIKSGPWNLAFEAEQYWPLSHCGTTTWVFSFSASLFYSTIIPGLCWVLLLSIGVYIDANTFY